MAPAFNAICPAVRPCLALACTAAFLFASPSQAQTTSAEVNKHIIAGRAAADPDFPGYRRLCDVNNVGARAIDVRGLDATSPHPAMKIFDNLYFVSDYPANTNPIAPAAYVIKTSAGLILIDTLNNTDDAVKIIEPGIRKVGLDPADIKYIIVTHSHGDHYGGADYFVQKYGARAVSSEIDWTDMERQAKAPPNNPNWGAPPKRDVVVADGEVLKLGDTEVTFYVTPGHTSGTLSTVFPVFDNGVRHTAMMWGGNGFGSNVTLLKQYGEQARRMDPVARAAKVDVVISNHLFRDGGDVKMAQLEKRVPGEAHPYVLGPARAVKLFTVLSECAAAKLLHTPAAPTN